MSNKKVTQDSLLEEQTEQKRAEVYDQARERIKKTL